MQGKDARKQTVSLIFIFLGITSNVFFTFLFMQQEKLCERVNAFVVLSFLSVFWYASFFAMVFDSNLMLNDRELDKYAKFSTGGRVFRSWDGQIHQLILGIIELSDRLFPGHLALLRFIFIPVTLAVALFVVYPIQAILNPFIFSYQDAKRAWTPFEIELFAMDANGNYRFSGQYYHWKRDRMRKQLSDCEDYLLQLVHVRDDFIDQYEVVPDWLKNKMVTQLLKHDSLRLFIFNYSLNFMYIMDYSTVLGKEELVEFMLRQRDEWERLVRFGFDFARIMKNSSSAKQEKLINYLLNNNDEWDEWQRLIYCVHSLICIMEVSSSADQEKLIDYLLTHDRECLRLLQSDNGFINIFIDSFINNFIMIMKVSSSACQEKLIDYLLNKNGKWLRRLVIRSGDNFRTIFCATNKSTPSQLKWIRYLIHNDEEGGFVYVLISNLIV